MQEFSSVTASSYDADALAPLLSEKSADGWDVVSIVSAGTNIVAYLRRESTGDTATDESTDTFESDTVDDSVDTAIIPVDVPAVEEPVVETPAVQEPVVAEPAVEEPVVEPVDEPAGWGTAPEPDPTPVAEPEPVVEPVVEAVAPEPVVEEPAVAEPAPAESAVPAGWYADPSGRYELRYWDGNAWTEHVSRAGQQFTDPPVA